MPHGEIFDLHSLNYLGFVSDRLREEHKTRHIDNRPVSDAINGTIFVHRSIHRIRQQREKKLASMELYELDNNVLHLTEEIIWHFCLYKCTLQSVINLKGICNQMQDRQIFFFSYRKTKKNYISNNFAAADAKIYRRV